MSKFRANRRSSGTPQKRGAPQLYVMRKPLLYFLYAIAFIFGCFAVYVSLRSGSSLAALFWLVVLSPILLNALRSPKVSDNHQPAVPLAQQQTSAAESVATGLSKLFKALAIFSLGLTVLFVLLAPFWVLSGFAMGYALMCALVSFVLAKAFE